MKTELKKQKFRQERLLKLADHLESGQLGHPKFDFTMFNFTPEHNRSAHKSIIPGCGTNGCAIGELPILFPILWKFDKRAGDDVAARPYCVEYFIDDDPCPDSLDHAARFFGIKEVEATCLFVPYGEAAPWVKTHLTNKATAKQVAKSIRLFVKWHGSHVSTAG